MKKVTRNPQDTIIYVVVPPRIKGALRKEASKKGISMNAIIASILYDRYAKEERMVEV